jgi:glycosyltransferase involved in cell wall biosynthesis
VRVLEIHQIHGNIGSATGFEAVSHGLRDHGFDVYQFSLDPQETVKKNGIYFLQIRKPNVFQQIFSFRIASALYSYIRKIRPDIIHFHAIDASLLGFGLPILYGKVKGAKVVKTQHDWGIICTNAWHVTEKGICDRTIGPHCQGCYAEKRYFFRDFFGKTLLRNPLFNLLVDFYTVPSAALLNDMQRFGYTNVLLIPNFLDKPVQKPAERPLNRNQLIFIGRFVKEKGIDQLIACMILVKKEIPDSELVIVGKGTPQEISHLHKLIDNMHGRDFIHVYEGASDSQKNELLQRSKVCIIPSIWKENFPLVVLEAFASSVPVIAFKIGGIPEIIQDDRALPEWKNTNELAMKAVQIIRDENLRQELIHKNNIRFNDFEKDKIINNWSNLFRALKEGFPGERKNET